jgi:hypothetical protein
MGDPTLPVARLDLTEREHRIRVYGFLDDHEVRIQLLEEKMGAVLILLQIGIPTGIGLLAAILGALLLKG